MKHYLIEIRTKSIPLHSYFNGITKGRIIEMANPFYAKKYKTRVRAEQMADKLNNTVFKNNTACSASVVTVDSMGNIEK